MRLSIMLEGQQGLTWERWGRLASLAEELGFDGLYRSDHFTDPGPPERDSLELVVSLTYLATATRRIHFGPCVAPVSFRDPIMFTRQASQIDDLSGGRMILGLGAGWQVREHTMFGYPLGDVATRMARYEESLEVAWLLLRGEGPATFEGRFYQLREAELLPRARRAGGPRIMIGGNGPRRTLGLAARYADIWNGVFLTPAEFAERTQALDGLLRERGREPSSVRRTLMTALHYGEDGAALEASLAGRAAQAGKRPADLAQDLRDSGRQIVGAPDEAIAQLRAYAEAGVEELFLQWLNLDDLDGLRSVARHVLPAFHRS